MKLQVYCGYTPALVSMRPEITVKTEAVGGLWLDTALKYGEQPYRPKSIIIVPPQPKEAFHPSAG